MTHALLAPSAAHRWLTCPASVQMSAKVIELTGPRDSEYSVEGTNAHTIAEIRAADAFGLRHSDGTSELRRDWEMLVTDEQAEEMYEHADAYVHYIDGLLTSDSRILLEQRVETGIDFCWGTADAVILRPKHLDVVDLKYGMGVRIDAPNNPQLRLYGVGALEMFADIDEIETVTTHIFQPRLNHVSTETITADDLRAWRDSIKPAAAAALGENPRFNPSLSACRFCDAAGECKPRMLHMTRMDFGDPDLLSPEELAEALSVIHDMRNWCNAVEALGLSKTFSQGVEVPGYKVVLSGGKRSIKDHEAAIRALMKKGYRKKDVSRTQTKTLGDLEKLVGKKRLAEILGDLIVGGLGKPSLVSEDDARPAIDPEGEAAKEFLE
jgi:hypothetical protein